LLEQNSHHSTFRLSLNSRQITTYVELWAYKNQEVDSNQEISKKE